MSCRNLIYRTAVICFFACLTGQIQAADGLATIESTADFVPLEATLRNEAIIGVQQIRRIYIMAGTNRFAVCVPETFRFEASNPSKVVLVQEDYKCFLAFRILAPPADGEPRSYRAEVLEQYPGSQILSEFAQAAGRHSGSAFDIQWTSASHVAQSARIVFVESKVGLVELVLLSQSDKFAESKRFFDYLRFSFCTDQEGPIKPIETPLEPPAS